MNFIGLTMRADKHPVYAETRDAIDQEWFGLLSACNYTPILLPNNLTLVKTYLDTLPLSGIILSGGNSPVVYGGDSSARDEVDNYLIHWAQQQNKPLLGVCRGMQSIQLAFAQELEPVTGHVCAKQDVIINGESTEVNSYHTLATKQSIFPIESWANSPDGVVKAISHGQHKIHGFMWHPERIIPYRAWDIAFIKKVFSS
jgi:gamma-glutamyl-gamma-aminobutyrate hydrolase PuuD